MKEYDIMVVGPVSLDHNIDYLGNERKEVGGAVVASGFAAAGSGAKTAIFCKSNAADGDPFRFEELPQVKTKVYHFAGLVYGDFDGALLTEAAKHGKVGLDVQCMLRHVEPDKSMAFHDWAEKKELLPLMDYFKTDAAEAEVLTGLTDRVEAAKMLHDWGAKEVVITHNTEVLAYDGEKVYTCPIKARNLSGRTGRGDTTFAGYIAERQRGSVEEALNFCTALVSLKMETPGPFKGTREDVLAYMKEFY